VIGLMPGLLLIPFFAVWIIESSVVKPIGLDGASFAQPAEL